MWIASDSNYSRKVINTPDGRRMLILKDLDGRVTLTNNMEAVLKHEVRRMVLEGADPKQIIIIYQDSTGTFDGVDYDWFAGKVDFYSLNVQMEENAINKALTLRLAEHLK